MKRAASAVAAITDADRDWRRARVPVAACRSAAVFVTLDHSASADAAGVPRPGRRWLPVRWLLTTLLVAAAVALAVAGAYRWAWKVAVDRSREAGEQRLELYVNALRAELERVEYLPGVFADDPEV